MGHGKSQLICRQNSPVEVFTKTLLPELRGVRETGTQYFATMVSCRFTPPSNKAGFGRGKSETRVLRKLRIILQFKTMLLLHCDPLSLSLEVGSLFHFLT